MKLIPRPLSGIRQYESKRARSLAIARLRKFGRNYFVGYCDSHDPAKPFGLSFGFAEWAGDNEYRKDC